MSWVQPFTTRNMQAPGEASSLCPLGAGGCQQVPATRRTPPASKLLKSLSARRSPDFVDTYTHCLTWQETPRLPEKPKPQTVTKFLGSRSKMLSHFLVSSLFKTPGEIPHYLCESFLQSLPTAPSQKRKCCPHKQLSENKVSTTSKSA